MDGEIRGRGSAGGGARLVQGVVDLIQIHRMRRRGGRGRRPEGGAAPEEAKRAGGDGRRRGEALRRWRLVATRWGAGAASPWLGRRGGEREAAEARREAAAAEDGGGEARAAGAGRRGLQCGERRRRMGPARPGSARGGPDLGPEWHGGGGRWRR